MINALVDGKVARVGELKTSAAGKKFFQFSISTTVEKETTYVSCVTFEALAEIAALVSVGANITAKGPIKMREYEGKYSLSMIVNEMVTL